MTDPLDGVISKIDRAHAHLSNLQPEVDRVIERARNAVTREREVDRPEYVFRFDVAPRPAMLLSNIFGDALHNLRSALDHLANRTVAQCGVKSRIPTRGTNFVVLPNPLTPKKNGQPA